MTQNKISEGVMLIKKTENSVWYRICCDCMDEKDDAFLHFEFDKLYKEISLTFYKKFYFQYELIFFDKFFDKCKYFLKLIWWRIKSAFRIIFCGYIELESDMFFVSKEHIENIIKVLDEGIKYIENANIDS